VQPSSELEAVVRRFLAARLARDVDAMLSLHSNSEWVTPNRQRSGGVD